MEFLFVFLICPIIVVVASIIGFIVLKNIFVVPLITVLKALIFYVFTSNPLCCFRRQRGFDHVKGQPTRTGL